ncbi:MAG: MFS transporter [Chloroflexia bacterium]|nr:MFS transporter [Chloroflexia bacterium]
MATFLRVLRGISDTLRLALPKIGAGWMFALLTSNFNRVSIFDLGIAAVIITVMISMHNFLSPFQVVFGRMSDRYPILGFRRTPYFFIGSMLASLVFMALPNVAVAMSQGQSWAYVAGFALLLCFGIGFAATGDSHHSLIAEVTTSERRGIVVAVVWTFTIISAIAAAIVVKATMGDTLNMVEMQRLYNFTPLVVFVASLPMLGMEKRRTAAELQTLASQSQTAAVSPWNAIGVAYKMVRSNEQVRAFFGFVFFSILGIFLQDAILEVFGAEVFHMTIKQTSSFNTLWGSGVLIGMILMGVISSTTSLSKKLIGQIGGFGTAFGLGLLTLSAMLNQQSLLTPSLLIMGLFTGFYNVGALSMMMDMTVEGSTGLYMGMWGMAQSFGMGISSILSGALKSALIETHLFSATVGYAVIFGFEVVLMVVGMAVLRNVNVQRFRSVSVADLTLAMEQGAGA